LINDIKTSNPGAPRSGRHIPGQNAHRCRFAGTIWTQETQNFALLGVKAEIFDSAAYPIILRQPFNGIINTPMITIQALLG
jgi:hypothetical protein